MKQYGRREQVESGPASKEPKHFLVTVIHEVIVNEVSQQVQTALATIPGIVERAMVRFQCCNPQNERVNRFHSLRRVYYVFLDQLQIAVLVKSQLITTWTTVLRFAKPPKRIEQKMLANDDLLALITLHVAAKSQDETSIQHKVRILESMYMERNAIS